MTNNNCVRPHEALEKAAVNQLADVNVNVKTF